MSLVPCPDCTRHVRPGICAFCNATVHAAPEPIEPERTSRAAYAAFAVTAAAALAAAAACGDSTSNKVVKDPSGTMDADGGQQQQQQFEDRHPGGGGQNMPYGAPPANGVIKRVV